MKILCFSDWRSQKIKYIKDFVGNLEEKPDLILYAGDDTRRFVEADNEESLSLISGIQLHIPVTFDQVLAIKKIAKRKKTTRKKQKTSNKYKIIPLTIESVAEYIFQDLQQFYIYFDTINYDLSELKKTYLKILEKNNNVRRIWFDQANILVRNTNQGGEVEEENYSSGQFQKKYPGIIQLINLLNLKDYWKSIHRSSDGISIYCIIANIFFTYDIDMENYSHISITMRRKRSTIYQWLLTQPNIFTKDELTEYLKTDFVLKYTQLLSNYQIQLVYQADQILNAKPDLHWSTLLTLNEDSAKSQLLANHFEDLAKMSKYGLLAIIGNDGRRLDGNLIFGKNVINLHNNPVMINDVLFFGLEGSESLVESSELRSVHGTTSPINRGYTIYSKRKYDEFLKILQSKKYKNKPKVIVSHSPPFKCLDHAVRFGQEFIGSIALREAIEKDSHIFLTICGHVHLFGGKDERLHNALVVNCSSHDHEGALGNVAIVDYNEKLKDITNIEWYQLGSNLRQIWGIGVKYAEILEEGGVIQIQEIDNYSVKQLNNRTLGKIGLKRLKKIKLQAKALLNNEILIQPYSRATSLDLIQKGGIIDIETDLNQSQIWCIGILHNSEVKQFFLDNPEDLEQEKKMLEEFIAHITTLYNQNPEEFQLYCYSMTNFDFRVIKNRLLKFGMRSEIFELLTKIDLGNELKKRAYIPTTTYDLKTVADFFKYEKIADLPQNYNGIMASINYYKSFKSNAQITPEEKSDKKQELIAYNTDDLQMVKFIWEKLEIEEAP